MLPFADIGYYLFLVLTNRYELGAPPVNPEAQQQAIRTLIQQLLSQDNKLQSKALEQLTITNLRDADSFYETLVPILQVKLRAPDPNDRANAASILGDIGTPTNDVVNSLLPLLEDRDSYVRWQVIYSLSQLKEPVGVVVPALIKTLSSPNASDREAAATALKEIGGSAQSAVPTLAARISDDPDPSTREAAVEALGSIQAAPQAVLSALRVAINDPSSGVRLSVVKASEFIGVPATSILLTALKDSSAAVRASACQVLGEIKPSSEAVVQPLHAAVSDSSFIVRLQAMFALQALAETNQAAVLALASEV